MKTKTKVEIETEDNSQEWNTLANKVTIVRILLIPVFFIILLAPWPEWFFGTYGSSTAEYVTDAIMPWIAAVVYAALAFTDGVDGYLARSRNEITTLGKFMDPLADKILVAAALLALVELGSIPSWIVLLIIAREFIVSGLRMMAATRNIVIAAQMSGKIKTVLTLIAVILFILRGTSFVEDLPHTLNLATLLIAWAVMIAALIMTYVSMGIYFKQSMYLFTGARSVDEVISDETKEIVLSAVKKGIHIATAESLTGGLIGAMLTSIPGSSETFEGGFIVYSNNAKKTLIGVSEETLDKYTAVSEQVALEMACGTAEKILGAYDDDKKIAVSVTGVAGPGADSDGNAQGKVWIGVCGCGITEAYEFDFEGNRESVRKNTVKEALKIVLDRIRKSDEPSFQDTSS